MDRRTFLVILVLAVLSLASWVLAVVFRPHDDDNAFAGPPRSDYTLHNFTLDALDENGAHSFTVIAPRLARRGDDGSITVDTPNYEIIDNSGHTWLGTSDSAWVDKDGTLMKLDGDVRMHRVPTETVVRVDLLTTNLVITTDPKPKDAAGHNLKVADAPHRDKRMHTDAITTIIDPSDVSHGIGMKADLDLKTVEFFSDVHTISLPSTGRGK